MTKTLLLLIVLFGLSVSSQILAQETGPKSQNPERIRGTRFIPFPNYSGKPFLNDNFMFGEIEFADGTRMEHVGLNYCTYRDELIYYNTVISTQIQIDKISLNGFSFTDNSGKKRTFHRQYCSGSIHDQCYFELLSEGDPSLLVYRKVNLETCDTYYSKSGLAYQPAYIYYLYSKEKGYKPINLTRKSLLTLIDKQDQKAVRKLLRKNSVYISDEPSMVKAWNLVKEKNFALRF